MLVKRLAHAPELLDGPLDREVLAGNLRITGQPEAWRSHPLAKAMVAVITGVHAHHRVARVAVRGDPVGFLDVGTGAADIPEALIAWAGSNGIGLNVVAVDSRDEILDFAYERIGERADLHLDVARGERLPYETRSFDVAHTSMVLHHLEPDDAVRLISEMARVSRTGIIVNDLDRTMLGWLGAWLLAHLFTRNRYTRHDAPLSVRRAYRPAQIAQMAALAGLIEVARVHAFAGHRYALAFVHAKPPDEQPADAGA